MPRTVLEQVLELKINEEHEAAEELLHNFIVENAREILADMLAESDGVVEEDLEEIDESYEEFGEDDADQYDEEIDTEEFYDEDPMDDEEAMDDLEMDDMGDDMDMGDELGVEDEPVEARVDDLESAMAELEAEFAQIMAGDADDEDMDMDDEDMDMDDEESDDEEDDEEEIEESLREYVDTVSAKEGDNGDGKASPNNHNPKRPGDDSNAAPVKMTASNTKGGKGDSPKDMATKNVNVSGNKKAPAFKNHSAKEGDDGVNKKSVTNKKSVV